MKFYRILHAGVLQFSRRDGIVPEDQFPAGTDFGRLLKLGAVVEAPEAEFKAQEDAKLPEDEREKAADEARSAAPTKDAPLPKHAPSGDPAPRNK